MKHQSAFPTFEHDCNLKDEYYLRATGDGMTLLDYFAAKALPAIIKDAKVFTEIINANSPESVTFGEVAAKAAYQYADAMLEERKKYLNQENNKQ